jgi:hypothetical protein
MLSPPALPSRLRSLRWAAENAATDSRSSAATSARVTVAGMAAILGRRLDDRSVCDGALALGAGEHQRR